MTKPIILDAEGRPMQRATAAPIQNTGTDTALAGWRPGLKSADATILPARNKSVARARDLTEGNGFASGSNRRTIANVLGTGLRLDYQPVAEALGLDSDEGRAALEKFVRQVESEFKLYANDLLTGPDHTQRRTLGGLAIQAFWHYFVDGDACTLPRWSKDKRRRYQTNFQNIDPDRLSNPNDKNWLARNMRMGVEKSTSGRPVAYHIREAHPSDRGFGRGERVRWRRIPAFIGTTSRRAFIHYFKQERADQSRGTSRMAAVLEKFKKLDIFQDSSLQAAILSAMFGFFITSPFDDALLADQLDLVKDSDTLSGYQGVRTNFHEQRKMSLGGVKPLILFPGEKPEALDNNRPSPEYAAFVKSFMEEMAAASGQSVEQFTQNWSETNYSSARAALNEAWKIIKTERDDFATYWYGAVFELWFEEALDKGYVQLPDGAPGFYEARTAWLNAEWLGPARGWVDPVKEIDAVEKRIKVRVSTLKKECAEQGSDWRDVAWQLKQEVDYFHALGLKHPLEADNNPKKTKEGTGELKGETA